MSNLTSILDTVATKLEALGLRKLAAEIDSVLNSLDSSSLDHNDIEEIERTVRELHLPYSPEDLAQKFRQARPEHLSHHTWARLQNTDSFGVRDEDDVRRLLVSYGRHEKNFDVVKKEVVGGTWYPPLILQVGGGDPYLVSGNSCDFHSKPWKPTF